MRELIQRIDQWCDGCFTMDGTKSEGKFSFSVAIGEGDKERPAVRVVDLCDEHAEPYRVISAFVVANGATPSAAPPAPIKHTKKYGPCPGCSKTANSPLALAKHIYTQHLPELEMPATPATRCPECPFKPAGGSNSTAVSIHRSQAHNTSTATDAIATWEATQKKARRG